MLKSRERQKKRAKFFYLSYIIYHLLTCIEKHEGRDIENSTVSMFANAYTNFKPAQPLLSLSVVCGIRKNDERKELSR